MAPEISNPSEVTPVRKHRRTRDRMISIPLSLARLITAEDDEFKSDANREDARSMARAMLRLLMVTDDAKSR